MATRQVHQDQLLTQQLRAFFGDLDPDVLAQLREQLQWVELVGGQTADGAGRARRFDVPFGERPAARLRATGRRRATHGARNGAWPGHRRDEPVHRRAALGHDRGDPRLGAGAARQVAVQSAARAQRAGFGGADAADHPAPEDRAPAGALCRAGDDRPDAGDRWRRPAPLCRRSGRAAAQDGRACASSIRPRSMPNSASPASANGSGADVELNRRIALLLDEVEADHDFVLLLSDTTPTPWTHRCSRHCDELLLLADADAAAARAPDRGRVPGAPAAAHRSGRDPGAAARRRP